MWEEAVGTEPQINHEHHLQGEFTNHILQILSEPQRLHGHFDCVPQVVRNNDRCRLIKFLVGVKKILVLCNKVTELVIIVHEPLDGLLLEDGNEIAGRVAWSSYLAGSFAYFKIPREETFLS